MLKFVLIVKQHVRIRVLSNARFGRELSSDPYYAFFGPIFRSDGTSSTDDPLCVAYRLRIFDEIFNRMNTCKTVLVNGTRRSGKSGTLQLLAEDAIRRGKYDKVYVLNGKRKIDQQIFKQSSGKKPLNITELFDNHGNERVLMLMDEAQSTYSGKFSEHETLWNCQRSVLKEDVCRIDTVYFALRDETFNKPGNIHPIEYTPSNTLNTDFLAFTREELGEMATKWNGLTPPELFDHVLPLGGKMSEVLLLTDKAVDTIFTLTKGHVGASRYLIKTIAERFFSAHYYRGPYPVGEDAIIKLLNSDVLPEHYR